MIRTGKCPHCTRVLPNVRIETIDILVGVTPKYHGVSFVCPMCDMVLQVEMDPIAAKADIATAVVKKLGKNP